MKANPGVKDFSTSMDRTPVAQFSASCHGNELQQLHEEVPWFQKRVIIFYMEILFFNYRDHLNQKIVCSISNKADRFLVA